MGKSMADQQQAEKMLQEVQQVQTSPTQ